MIYHYICQPKLLFYNCKILVLFESGKFCSGIFSKIDRIYDLIEIIVCNKTKDAVDLPTTN